jgi:aspartyl protease family protein
VKYVGLCSLVVALLGGMLSVRAGAADLALSGILGNKALLTVNNGSPQMLAVGKSTSEGVKLLAIDGEIATVEFEGRRHLLRLGERVVRQGSSADRPGVDGLSGERAREILARGVEMTIQINEKGQFVTPGEINGGGISFLVDTGATHVSIGYSDALRLGLRQQLSGAEASTSQTAGGVVKSWLVKLDSVKIGSIRLRDVEGVVQEKDMPFALLGMSFLKSMEMQRKGDSLHLRKLR